MTTSPLVLLRAIGLVSLILSLSCAAHVLASGHLPPPSVLCLLAVLVLIPVRLLARRTVSFRSALLTMGAGQVLLHEVFGLTAVPAVCSGSAAGPGHHAALELACSPVMIEQPAASGNAAMLLLHAAATVLLALVVARSDAAIAFLRAWLRPLLAPAVLPAAVPRSVPLIAPLRSHVPSGLSHAGVPTLRGPPRPVGVPAH